MPVPDFQSIMLPFVVELSDGRERTIRELTAALADQFQLTDAEKQEMLPSGEQTLFSNRVAWAKTHLKNAGLIENPSRGKVRIADIGLQVLAQKPEFINGRFLKRFPSYLRFIGQSPDESSTAITGDKGIVVESIQTPQELIDSSFQTLRKATAEDLLDRLKKCSPGFF